MSRRSAKKKNKNIRANQVKVTPAVVEAVKEEVATEVVEEVVEEVTEAAEDVVEAVTEATEAAEEVVAAEEAVEEVTEEATKAVEEATEAAEEVVEETTEVVEEAVEEVTEEATKVVEEVVVEATEVVEEEVAEVAEEVQESKKIDFCLMIQYYGKEMNVATLMQQVKEKAGEVSNLNVYIKVEDKRAYYVKDDEPDSGNVELWTERVASTESYDLDAPFNQNVYFQFRGKEVKLTDMMNNVERAIKMAAISDKGLENIEQIEFYVKFEDETVYYLINNSIEKKIGMFS